MVFCKGVTRCHGGQFPRFLADGVWAMPRRLPKIKYTDHDEGRREPKDKRSRSDERSEFERDRSRIIHSGAFRRLQGKTQVFTVGEGDFFRTRLTHSLEVAQIGKGLALRLGADTDLVEAVSLAHDIGHPPFGHAGEEALKELMQQYGGFEANAQNLRIFTLLEAKDNEYKGLNLTRAVIDGQMKYKKAFPDDKRKFIYHEHLDLMDWGSREAREAAGVTKIECKSFECQIMDWADEVAYAVHDLEDSIHAGFIGSRILYQDLPEIEGAISEVSQKFEAKEQEVEKLYQDLRQFLYNKNPDFQMSAPASSHRERKANRKQLTSLLIQKYIQAAQRVERTPAVTNPVSRRYLYSIEVPWEHRVEVALINKIISRVVIQSPQVSAFEEKGKNIVRCLFLKLMENDNVHRLLPDDWREYLNDDDSECNRARVVADYVSGMTDGYAQKTYARLFLPQHGSIYEVL